MIVVNAFIDITITTEVHMLLSSYFVISSPSMNGMRGSTNGDKDIMLSTVIKV